MKLIHMKDIAETWAMLNRPIHTGKRLEDNLRALTSAGIMAAVLGLALIVVDLITGRMIMLIAAVLTMIFGAGCAYFAGVKKRRDIAILSPTIFCGVMFTIYTVTGAMGGSAVLWAFLAPVGICYFVSVKYGIILGAYYTVFFILFFNTPIYRMMGLNYSEAFVSRFPVILATMAILTDIAMIQYHKGVLLENEYADQLNTEVEKQTRVARDRADRLETLSGEMVETLATTIDAKDRYTNGHSFRVSWYSVALARALNWEEYEIKELEREALLHDVGKIGVPDQVLNKPGRLTDDEFVVIQSHTIVGGNILSRSKSLLDAAEVARHHHERYDGRGYPDKLAGDAIPRHARVVAIADAYDAMHSDRIYRKGLPNDVIRDELVKGRAKQFDPEFLDVFLQLLDFGALDEVVRQETLAAEG